MWNCVFTLIILCFKDYIRVLKTATACYLKLFKVKLWLERKDMNVNEHERISNITLGHKFK
jgi:hypothetical protein